MKELPVKVEQELKDMALEAAFGSTLSGDITPDNWQPLLAWFESPEGTQELGEIDDVWPWMPLEDEPDEKLRGIISAARDANYATYKQVFLMGVQEVLPTLEWISRCANARLAGCDAYFIKPDVMDKAKELVEQYNETENED